MLEVERVDTFYGETQALFGATMTIRPGIQVRRVPNMPP